MGGFVNLETFLICFVTPSQGQLQRGGCGSRGFSRIIKNTLPAFLRKGNLLSALFAPSSE
jgi:hypothetical protein